MNHRTSAHSDLAGPCCSSHTHAAHLPTQHAKRHLGPTHGLNRHEVSQVYLSLSLKWDPVTQKGETKLTVMFH